MAKEHIVIVGSGMAGGKLIEELLAKDPKRFSITVIGEEPCGNYDRIKLVYKMLDDNTEDFWLNPLEWYTEKGIKTFLGQRAVHIDPEKKFIQTVPTQGKDNGHKISYDKLILALGSRPFVPPIKGSDQYGVFTLRTLADAKNIRRAIEGQNRIMVIGGGLLGLEMAYALKSMGKQIVVSHLMSSLMERQLDAKAAGVLARKLAQKGMEFVMGTYVTEIARSSDDSLKISLYSGGKRDVDAVIINTGIIPVTDLADEAGIFTNQGILVNEMLETSTRDIFAVGECIEYKGKTWGLVAPVYEQVRVLAANLVGESMKYQDSSDAPVRLKCDVPVLTMGKQDAGEGEDVITFDDPHSLVYKKLIVRGQILVGAVIVGDERNLDAISLHYTAKLPLPSDLTQLLFPGSGENDSAIPDASAWPDEITICDCNGVTAGKIREVIAQGNDTAFSAGKVSRAGTGCGICKNRVKALLVDAVGELKQDPRELYYLPGIPLKREEVEAFILEKQLHSVSEVLDALAAAGHEVKGDALTRMGLDYLLIFLWKGDYKSEKESQFVNDRYHGNIQKDGTFSVIPRVHGGVIEVDQLQRMADVARKYKVKMIKVTGADRLGLFSVKREDLPQVWKELGMESGHAYGKFHRAAKACVGSDFCRFGLKNSIEMGKMMDDRYRGTMFPAKTKMAASGCPRNCAEASIKDFGVIATTDGWDIYIGGNAGAKVVAAKKLTQVQTDEEVFKIADRFFEYYRRHGNYHERTAPFVERIGMEKVTDAILFDTNENLGQLEQDFQDYLDSYQDPWKQTESWQKKPDVVTVDEK